MVPRFYACALSWELHALATTTTLLIRSKARVPTLRERRPMRPERTVEHRLFGSVPLAMGLVRWVVERSALSHGRAHRGRSVPARTSAFSAGAL